MFESLIILWKINLWFVLNISYSIDFNAVSQYAGFWEWNDILEDITVVGSRGLEHAQRVFEETYLRRDLD